MRVMVLVKASADSEAGKLPSAEMFAKMGAFNEELVKAGVMLAGDGLKPSKAGKRVTYDGTKATIVDGPFAETKELVAGYWIWQVRSVEEAAEWLKRAPFLPGDVVEIRPFYELEDFAEVVGPEVIEQEKRQRAQVESQQRS